MFASVIHACMAVATGMCRHVARLPGAQRGDGLAHGRPTGWPPTPAGVTGTMQWMLPFGAFSGPTWMGHWATRHMHEFGTTREQIAEIALNARRNAAAQPEGRAAGRPDARRLPVLADDQRPAVPVRLRHRGRRRDGPDRLHRGLRAGRARARRSTSRPSAARCSGRASWDQWEDMTQTAAAERRRAPLVADRPQAGRRRRREPLRRLHRPHAVLARGPGVLRQGRERAVRRGRQAHRARRRAAAGHQRRPALGRPAARLRPPLRGVPAAARRGGRPPGQGREGRGDVGGRRAARLLPAAEDGRMKSRQVQLVEYPRGPVEPRALPRRGGRPPRARPTARCSSATRSPRSTRACGCACARAARRATSTPSRSTPRWTRSSPSARSSSPAPRASPPATRSRTPGVGATTRWSRRASTRSAASGRCAGSTRRSPRPSSSSARWATWP